MINRNESRLIAREKRNQANRNVRKVHKANKRRTGGDSARSAKAKV